MNMDSKTQHITLATGNVFPTWGLMRTKLLRWRRRNKSYLRNWPSVSH